MIIGQEEKTNVSSRSKIKRILANPDSSPNDVITSLFLAFKILKSEGFWVELLNRDFPNGSRLLCVLNKNGPGSVFEVFKACLEAEDESLGGNPVWNVYSSEVFHRWEDARDRFYERANPVMPVRNEDVISDWAGKYGVTRLAGKFLVNERELLRLLEEKDALKR